MKVSFFLSLILCLGLSVRAQSSGVAYSPEQLDQLVGPIALYPDPLVALILPAATVTSDITLAATYLAANGPANGINAQSWDPSVKALARFPAVVKWMNDNLDWTEALGAAFAEQPADVMKSIQQLRVRARAAGTLIDTPQQILDIEGDNIRIIPAQSDAIYVPEYDPGVVYDDPVGYVGPFIAFGVGYPVGEWLDYQCDWDVFGIWVGPWRRGWAYHREWQHPGEGRGGWHPWRPDPYRSHATVRDFYRPEERLPRPGFVGNSHPQLRRSGESPRNGAPGAPARADYRGRGIETPRPSSPAPSSRLLGGYSRGSETRDNSARGQMSRSAPVRTPSPVRESPPVRGAPPDRSDHSGNRDRH